MIWLSCTIRNRQILIMCGLTGIIRKCMFDMMGNMLLSECGKGHEYFIIIGIIKQYYEFYIHDITCIWVHCLPQAHGLVLVSVVAFYWTNMAVLGVHLNQLFPQYLDRSTIPTYLIDLCLCLLKPFTGLIWLLWGSTWTSCSSIPGPKIHSLVRT